MSIYSNVTEQNLINLRKLVEQQKNQRASKIKSRVLKETHDIKIAESLSPITKRLDEVKETTQKIGDVIKKSQPETIQLAIENTPTHQSIENNEGKIYDVQLENTLKNTENNKTGFFKTYHHSRGGWMWNGYPFKLLRGTEVEIKDKKIDKTSNLQKVFTQTSNIPLKN